MSESSRSCTVVGAGVSGLTTAIRLREAGWDAHIVAERMPHDTVSVVAAAVWTTTEATPVAKARLWAIRSREVFSELAADPATGVVPLRQRELEPIDPGPSWWEDQTWVRRLEPAELPDGYAAGWLIDGFMVEPPIYLDWLLAHFHGMGGTVALGRVEDLEGPGEVVVNCTGLGARDVAGDGTVYPIRGQVVAVHNPGIRDAVSDESNPDRITYVYPRSREIILGGVREAHRDDATADAATTARILADCRVLDPRIEGQHVIGARVGMRPGRPEVRVELERRPSGVAVAHNYGHGGAGFILSWGCAEDVVRLLADV